MNSIPWKIPREEWIKNQGEWENRESWPKNQSAEGIRKWRKDLVRKHRKEVCRALREGEQVPQKVLVNYPALEQIESNEKTCTHSVHRL